MLPEERKSSHTSFSELLKISVDTVLNADQEIKTNLQLFPFLPETSHAYLTFNMEKKQSGGTAM